MELETQLLSLGKALNNSVKHAWILQLHVCAGRVPEDVWGQTVVNYNKREPKSLLTGRRESTPLTRCRK